MKTGAMTVLLFTLPFLSLFSTANAGNFLHGMDGRVREIRFDRAERFGREHAGREGFGREGFAREGLGREHELRAHDLREHAVRENFERERAPHEDRELRATGQVQPLPYYTRAEPVRSVQNVPSGFTKR